MALLSIRGYAKHRGVSHEAVRLAVKDGKLKNSILSETKDGKKPIVLIDPEAADQEWPNGGGATPKLSAPQAGVNEKHAKTAEVFHNARTARESYAAKIAKLEYDKRSGKVAEIEEIKKVWTDAAAKARTAFLAVPSKMRQRVPEFSESQYHILEEIIRETLEHLSKVKIDTTD